MVVPTTGSVILLAFPYSDLSRSKLRPAAVLADADQGDWVLCQITSNPYSDPRAVALTTTDFASGGLRLTSYARPAKLFTAHRSLFTAEVGRLHPSARQRIVNAVIAALR